MGDASTIIVGTAGKAYMADVGATFPTGPEAAWGASFTDLGFVTPDGLEEAPLRFGIPEERAVTMKAGQAGLVICGKIPASAFTATKATPSVRSG